MGMLKRSRNARSDDSARTEEVPNEALNRRGIGVEYQCHENPNLTKGSRHPLRGLATCLQRLIQVGDDVGNVLNPN